MSYTFDQIASKATYGNIKMSVAGCGPCSIGSLAYNLIPDKNLHETVFKYMASKGYMPCGSTRLGMSETLDHFGVGYKSYATSFSTWAKGIKETGYGIVLVHGPNADWSPKPTSFYTAGGHYLSITAYRNENNVEEVYIRDSGARRRTGWQKLNAELKTAFISGWVISGEKWDKKAPEVTKRVAQPTLKLKSKGEEVKILQQNLNAIGAKLTEDGSFGPATKAAVINILQKPNGLQPDGSYGPKSFEKMKELIK